MYLTTFILYNAITIIIWGSQKMKTKIFGIFIVMLLIATSVLPVVSTLNNGKISIQQEILNNENEPPLIQSNLGMVDDDWFPQGALNTDSIFHIGNVGIGINIPSYKLHVMDRIGVGIAGSVAGTVSLFPPDGSGWYHIDVPGGTGLRFSGGGSPGVYEYLTIVHPGNVGIGTIYPNSKLEVDGMIHSTSSAGGFKFPDGTVQTTAATGGGGADDDWAWSSGDGLDGDIYHNGKVGIGLTSSPTYKLEVQSSGDGFKVGNDNSWFEFRTGGNSRVGLGDGNGNEAGYIASGENDLGENAIVIAGCNDAKSCPSGTYFHENGNVGMGTDSPGGHRLHVVSQGGGVSGSTVQISNTDSSGLALTVDSDSSDVTMLVTQLGSGDIFRCDSYTGGWHPVFKVENDGTTTCSVLKVTGGSDIAEPFSINEKDIVKPGMVVVIDKMEPGRLKISHKAYDRCVAGVVSGAGGIEPGLMITQEDLFTGMNVALAGRVYALCDANYGAIEPGDLLTTSPTSGYAMKVMNYEMAQGAILGKAMSVLESERGLVLILVTLQ